MSRLNELIQELCPDGVEYKKVKDVYKRLRGTSITATKMKEINISSGEIRIFAGGKTVINAREKDIPKANITRVPAVLVQSRGIVDVIYYEKPFTFKNEMWAYTAKDKIEVKFLFYMFKNNIMKFREAASGTGSLPQISLSVTEEFLIPVPPIEVQHEIVRILDNFTELTTELTTELIARKKQYEYYRDYLLSHKRYEVRLIPVGELFDFKNGINKGKESFGAGTPIVNFTNVFRKNKIYSSELQGRVQVTDEEIERYSAKKGDVFFTRTSETKEEIGITSVLMEDIDRCVFSGFILRARPKTELLLPEYCAYCFSSTEARKYIVRHSTYTTRALTNGTVLSKMILPVPPLHIQKKIVDVLDNFDAICKDLDIGLPAEIEARQKQYEYYRDMLLTFVETGDTILPDQTRPDQR